jgi:hypothetical protein
VRIGPRHSFAKLQRGGITAIAVTDHHDVCYVQAAAARLNSGTLVYAGN